MPFRALAPQASASANSATRTGRAPTGSHLVGSAVEASTRVPAAPGYGGRHEQPRGGSAGPRAERPARHRAGSGGRGRRHLPGPDPDRHQQLRRRLADRASARPPSYVAGLLRRGRAGARSCSRATPAGPAWWPGSPGEDREPRRRCCCTATSTSSRRSAEDWQVDPFSGEERDGCLWGRGAVDMKDMDAMILACVRAMLARPARGPPRDVVRRVLRRRGGRRRDGRALAGRPPARSCSRASPRRSARSAASRVTSRRDQRAYLLQTAEKGIAWLRLTAHGRAGHGSQVPNDDNAVIRLAEAVARIGGARVAARGTRRPCGRSSTASASSPARRWSDEDLERAAAAPRRRGPLGSCAARCRTPPTRPMLDAGYKHNVIPRHAPAALSTAGSCPATRRT